MLIRIRKPSDILSSEITPKPVFLKRRDFIKSAVIAGASIALQRGLASSSAFAATPSIKRVKLQGIVKGSFSSLEEPNNYNDITSYNNFYEFGTGKNDPKRHAQNFKTTPWTIKIEGEVGKPSTIGFEDLIKGHKLEERIYRFRCVEAWSMVVPWVGIPLADVLRRFEPTGNAKFVAFETLYDPKQMPGQNRNALDWPYVEGLRIDEAMHPLTLLAVGLYGELMPNQNGAPIRLIVPWKYGFKSIKSIVKIKLTEKVPPTSWNLQAPQEYGFYSNVNPEVNHRRWSQKKERRLGKFLKQPTLMLNGYADEVGGLYAGMDMKKNF
jgi:sulfoxide reductase catalytic subunit YedY